ncbi:MAG: TauD/TfdA family dioxygenase [bacterium]|nr:TauD/TfdA family dioxygenase [bacterium]
MSSLHFQPVTSAIGANVEGVDLRAPLAEEDRAGILEALTEYHVLFFRNQDITPEQQVAFAKQFGPISIPPFAPKYGDDPEYIVLDQTSPRGEGADQWHSDNTFMAEPPMGSILHAVQIPKVGGDTCFASAVAAYEALSPPIQRLVDGLTAVHDITKPLLKGIAAGHADVDLAEIQAKWPPVEHPVVRTHPITGKKALFVNRNSTTRIVGLTESENDALLPMLMDHIRSPEFQCRFTWDTNSVAFWDNRSTQHFAVPDYDTRRIMNRVTIAGEKVV